MEYKKDDNMNDTEMKKVKCSDCGNEVSVPAFVKAVYCDNCFLVRIETISRKTQAQYRFN